MTNWGLLYWELTDKCLMPSKLKMIIKEKHRDLLTCVEKIGRCVKEGTQVNGWQVKTRGVCMCVCRSHGSFSAAHG